MRTRRCALALPILGGLWLLLAGCQTTPARPSTKSATASAMPDSGRPSDAELDARAKAHAAYATGVIRQAKDDSAGMLEWWTRALEHDPANETLALEVARRRLARNEAAAALTVLKQAAARPAASAPVFNLLGLAHLQSGQPAEAIEAYRRALRQDDTAPGTYVTLARLLTEQPRADEAFALLQQAETREPDNAPYRLDLADLYLLLSTREPRLAETARARAIALLEHVAKTPPDEVPLLLRLADRFAALGRKTEAEAMFALVREKSPRNPLAAARLAELYLQSGRTAEGAVQLEAWQREDPINPVPVYFLGVVALERRDFARARERFHRAILLNPDYEPAQMELLSLELTEGRPADALAQARRVRERFGSGFRLEFLSALAHSQAKDFAAAKTAFAAAEKHGATNQALLDHRFYFQLGATLERAGERDEAIRYLRKSLDLQPDYDEALNHLGYMWAEQGENLVAAEDMIRRALKSEPDNPAYLDSLGWVLFQQGKVAEAIPPLERAVELLQAEPDETVLDHLGDAYARAERWADARKAWQAALAAGAGDAVKAKLEKLP
jgi:tetratricopeptide (TPR) repeat protein